MLRVGAPALDREAAMALVRELRDLESQMRRQGDRALFRRAVQGQQEAGVMLTVMTSGSPRR
jgi:hypothetical protein